MTSLNSTHSLLSIQLTPGSVRNCKHAASHSNPLTPTPSLHRPIFSTVYEPLDNLTVPTSIILERPTSKRHRTRETGHRSHCTRRQLQGHRPQDESRQSSVRQISGDGLQHPELDQGSSR